MSDNHNALILLVEDEPALATAFVDLLEESGYRVAWVATGLAAITALEQNQGLPLPDLILLDLNLPDMDGVTLMRRLASTARQLPPVIVCSAKPLPVVQAAAETIGAAAFFPKPCGADEFLAAMKAILSQPSMSPM